MQGPPHSLGWGGCLVPPGWVVPLGCGQAAGQGKATRLKLGPGTFSTASNERASFVCPSGSISASLVRSPHSSLVMIFHLSAVSILLAIGFRT